MRAMGEFNKDQGQADKAGQQTDKPAIGQFDKEQGGKVDQQGDNQETNEKIDGDAQRQ